MPYKDEAVRKAKAKEASRASYLRNKEKVLARQKERRSTPEGRAARAAYMADYTERNRKKMNAYQREWSRRNKDKRWESTKRWREANKDRYLEKRAQWQRDDYAASPQKYAEYRKQWGAGNPEKIRGYNRKWLEKRPGYSTEHSAQWRSRNPEKAAANSKRSHAKRIASGEVYRSARRKRCAERYASEADYRLMVLLRSRQRHALLGKMKAGPTKELLGAPLGVVKKFLERNGASLDWVSPNGWHVDHIRPLASYNLNDPEQQRLAFHYTNLELLPAEANRTKHAKWNGKSWRAGSTRGRKAA